MKEKINELKAQVYDRLVAQEQYKNMINILQSQIEDIRSKVLEAEKLEKSTITKVEVPKETEKEITKELVKETEKQK